MLNNSNKAAKQLPTIELFSSVLLVEDEMSHAALISRACRGSLGEIEHVTDISSGIEKLKTSLPDIVLCDLNLGTDTGLTLLQVAKQIRPNLPVIIMTSSNQIQDAINVMREGAWDYVIKDFDNNFQDRFNLSILRVAERKYRELRELELRAERDAFWAAAHTAPSAMAVLSTNSQVIFANSAFSEFVETITATKDIKNVSVIDLIKGINPEVATELTNQLEQSYTDSLWSSEISIEKNIGDKKNITTFELTLTAVSSQKLPELQLEADKLALTKKHVLWVRDISSKKAREQFQRDLLSTTTHDIKGPLAAIITCVELLDTTIAKESREHELILRITSCARNAITIIDELLSAKKMEDGVFVIHPKELNAFTIIEETCFEFEQMAESRKLKLNFEIDDSDLQIYADKIALMRLLSNLISNAIKFTPAGGEITVTGKHQKNGVMIRVQDTGQGIKANRRHILFEKYSRLDQHAQIDGTGLGLFVVRNIVDAHGGRIEVQSKVGAGTTFSVTFPDKK